MTARPHRPIARIGMQARNTKEIDGLMRNEKIHATTTMIGARTPMRIIMP